MALDSYLPFQTSEYPPSQVIAATTATPVPFVQDIEILVVQNNTAGALYVSLSHAATPGDLVCAAGAIVQLNCPAGTLSVSVYSTPGGTVNGAVTGGIVIFGYAR